MLAEGLIDAAEAAGVPLALNRVGSMLTPFFVKEKRAHIVDEFHRGHRRLAAMRERSATFFHAMLDNGVYLAPSQYLKRCSSDWYIPSMIIEQTIKSAEVAFAAVRKAK